MTYKFKYLEKGVAFSWDNLKIGFEELGDIPLTAIFVLKKLQFMYKDSGRKILSAERVVYKKRT